MDMIFRRIFAGLPGALLTLPLVASDGSFNVSAPAPQAAMQYAAPRPIQSGAGFDAWRQNEADDFYSNESSDMPPADMGYDYGAASSDWQDGQDGQDGQAGPASVPAWPLAGSDADVLIAPDSAAARGSQNIQIVSKIGANGMTIENNINVQGDSFSGGADMTHSYSAPAGFYPYDSQSAMPFMHAEMPEDDGASVLAVSKSDRRARPEARRYEDFVRRNADQKDIEVDLADEPEAPDVRDAVRSWVIASGQNLRSVLQAWCDKEGWDLIWNTAREYPIAASAVFKGRFLDVSSALVRNFSRATPVPYAKFYKGNRVLVISTAEEE